MLKPMANHGSSLVGAHQRGVVLIFALIILVAMTLAGISLVRSLDTTNIIAGNLAFRQAATHAGDAGVEAAITWLEANNSGALLQASSLAEGYAASRQDPVAGQTWDAFWAGVLVPAGQVVTLAPDAAGNTVAYTIHRLCGNTGPPEASGSNCAVSPTVSSFVSDTSSKGSNVPPLQYSSLVYYRITARIAGPRNTVSYVQAIIAL